MKSENVTLRDGASIQVDGKLQTLLKELYAHISLDKKMVYSTQQLVEEMKNIVSQLSDRDRAQYLIQSLIINFKFFERELITEVYEKKKPNQSDP